MYLFSGQPEKINSEYFRRAIQQWVCSRVLHLLQVSFFYRISGINRVFSEIPAAAKTDVYNYIVAFLTQPSELTGNPISTANSLQVVAQS